MAARRRMLRAKRGAATERLIVVRFVGWERGPEAPCQELAGTINLRLRKTSWVTVRRCGRLWLLASRLRPLYPSRAQVGISA